MLLILKLLLVVCKTNKIRHFDRPFDKLTIGRLYHARNIPGVNWNAPAFYVKCDDDREYQLNKSMFNDLGDNNLGVTTYD